MTTRIRVRAAALGVGLLVLVGALWGYFVRGSDDATVPSQVRAAIVKDYPGMAFVPGRLPSGYHYASWAYSKRPGLGYVLVFQQGSVKSQLELGVQPRSCPGPPKWTAKGAFHVNGHALKWLQSDTGPIVWRCMTNEGRSFVIFGGAGPRRKLAELVGYAVPAH